jgi:hypothetical protein
MLSSRRSRIEIPNDIVDDELPRMNATFDLIVGKLAEISEGQVRRLPCVAQKREIMSNRLISRPRKLCDNPESGVIEMTLAAGIDLKFLMKRDILHEIENQYGKVLTYGWLHDFMPRHRDEIPCATIRPREDCRLHIPGLVLEQYLACVQRYVARINPGLVSNIEEAGCSD